MKRFADYFAVAIVALALAGLLAVLVAIVAALLFAAPLEVRWAFVGTLVVAVAVGWAAERVARLRR